MPSILEQAENSINYSVKPLYIKYFQFQANL